MGGHDDDSIESDFSSVVSKNKNKNNFRQTMKTDTRYEKYGRLLNKKWSDGRFYEYVTIENYGSGSQGSRIRNAVTGTRYNIPVGDLRENGLFKVMDSTGRYGRKDTLILYYDSPEQYENHHFVTVSPEIKKRWHERNFSFYTI